MNFLTSISNENHLLPNKVNNEFRIGTNDYTLQKRKLSVLENDNQIADTQYQPPAKKLKNQLTNNQTQFFKSTVPEKSKESENHEKDVLGNEYFEFQI